jgi:DNA-binding IclR family transcriptional regulator
LSKKEVKTVQSVDRALDILEIVVRSKDQLGVSEIGKKLGLHKSTVYRLISTLEQKGYIKKEEVYDKYKVGIKLFELSNSAINKLDIRKEVRPLLEELMNKTKETVHLGVLDDNEVVYIDKVQTTQTIMYSMVGLRAPVHCTGLGKAILAYSSEDVVNRIISADNFKKFTEHTITNPEDLKNHLKMIKERGYSIDDREHEENIRCISAPIFDNQGRVIAAFSVTGPSIRMTMKRLMSYTDLVDEYRIKMNRLMGYAGDKS